MNSRKLCGLPLLTLNIILVLLIAIFSNDDYIEFIGSIIGFKNELPLDYLDDQYCIEYNYLEATGSFHLPDGLEPVTLASHGTPDMLKHFENMPKMWDGPISVGIFIDFESQPILEYLSDLHRCDTEFNQKMTIHFAYRKSLFQDECPAVDVPKSNLTCQEFLKNKKSIAQKIPSPFFLYPYNVMRNIARRGAKSDLHFVMDGDMIVSEGMAGKIKKIANEMLDGDSKNVLLVRRFESKTGADIPRTVGDLENSMKKNETFEFHHKFFFSGHQIKNLPYWFDKSSLTEISSWNIPYLNQNWEPQPIVHRNAPYGADYIPSRIKDVQSMIYKLCRAEYKLHVLSHVFTVHEGVKTKNTVFSEAVATHQQIYAKERANERYIQELNTLYPDTLETCGEFYL